MLMVLIQTAIGCKEQYDIMEDVIVIDVIEESGRDANCTIFLYNSTSFLQETSMAQDGLLYSYNATRLPKDTYTVYMSCNYTATEYLGECKFEVGYFSSKMIIAMIILLPLILSIIFLIGAATLDGEHHKAMKIFLYLLSVLPFFLSMHFGLVSVVKFYDFPELQDTIGSTTYWVTIVFGIIVIYFLFYLFYTIFDTMAQKKKARLKY